VKRLPFLGAQGSKADYGLLILLLRPSFLSGTACILLTTTILASHTWEIVIGTIPLADTGVGALVAAAIDTIAWFEASVTLTLSQPWVYYVLLVCAAAAIACAVFIVLQATTGLVADVAEVIDESHMSGESIRRTFGETFGERLVLRAVVICAITVFWYITIRHILPYAMSVWDTVLPSVLNGQNLLQAAGVVAGMCLLWHMHILLLRLFFLRPRVFGGAYQIMSVL